MTQMTVCPTVEGRCVINPWISLSKLELVLEEVGLTY